MKKSVMKKLFLSKLRGKTVLLSALTLGLCATNGVLAHGGHLPAGSEYLHGVWHLLLGVGVVAVLLVPGACRAYGNRSEKVRNRGHFPRD
ncbi:MAG: hypothetical protein BECKG1743D_GA0114223_108282 [Candidatus Kentron sp. G]|nr:MAG: hypothetical protein BECKG1743F_GA0114225_107802 [Candidatus Kentron sp. G]VFN05037.1 MAG: hypothetical protein BECKG1743E_GA0114224_108132 [Candidatus Kentron sp. G]VFN06206.1 MAG: hypothetical protein BECKG1743D_GA0114223_108282 [Candidatus Kentron sp. G]